MKPLPESALAAPLPAWGQEGRTAFLARLAAMSRDQRLQAARSGALDRAQRAVWAAAYPGEIPLVNGEFEWIALGLADLD